MTRNKRPRTYAERSAAIRLAAHQRRRATARARVERQNGGPIGAAFAALMTFLFAMPGV